LTDTNATPVQHSLRRRTLLAAALPALLGAHGIACADEPSPMEKIRARGVLKVALYKDNAPYSDGTSAGMQGVDASLAQALAKQLDLRLAFLPFDAGENMGDDLRNMVWKGHYMGYGPADFMLHVPVDKYFMEENRQAFIFAPYARERLVVLHNPQTLPAVYNPEDLVGKKVGAEQGTGAASALMGYHGGLLRNEVALYKDGVEAARAVVDGKLAAAYVYLAQAEAAVFAAAADHAAWAFSELVLPGVPPRGWPFGIAVKADNKELARLLDEALQKLRDNGTLLEIFRSHGLTLAAP